MVLLSTAKTIQSESAGFICRRRSSAQAGSLVVAVIGSASAQLFGGLLVVDDLEALLDLLVGGDEDDVLMAGEEANAFFGSKVQFVQTAHHVTHVQIRSAIFVRLG